MAFSFGGIPDVFDLSVLADQERTAHDSAKNAAHEFFGAPDPVVLDHLAGRIAEQVEVQFLLALEFRQVRFRVGARAEDHYVQLVELLLCVAKLGRFGGSTGSVGFGEEENHNTAADQVFERKLASAVGLEFEVWSFLSDFQHWFHPKAPPRRAAAAFSPAICEERR